MKENHHNPRSRGGVAIYLHESIPYKQINLITPFQAVAFQVNLGTQITITSLYNSRKKKKKQPPKF